MPGPSIELANRTIRIRPPVSWHRVILDIPDVPPSMNTDKSRGWRSFYTCKRKWQDDIEYLLMAEKLSAKYQSAACGAIMRFPIKKKRRDESNFAGILNKSLGDALVAQGVIEDDFKPFYVFGGVEFEKEVGPPRTQIYIYLRPEEDW